MPRKKPIALPDRLSDLIELAVKDARACEADPRFKLYMQQWVAPAKRRGEPCQVCMAGSVLVQSLGFSPRREWTDAEPDDATDNKIFAVNDVRVGEIQAALYTLHAQAPTTGQALAARRAATLIGDDYSSGRDGGRAKWSTYLKAARMLREVGL
jgi:hypothetical protein